MKTKEISDQLVDCAINIAMYSLPGGLDTDKDALQAYKTLATDMLLSQPRKQLSKIRPFRFLHLGSKRQEKQKLTA